MVKEKEKLKIVIICLNVVIVVLAAILLVLLLGGNGEDTVADLPTDPPEETENPNLYHDPELGAIILPEWPTLPVNELDAGRFYIENGLKKYNAPGVTCGVDVSSWQGEIDWALVKAAGIDFAIVQLGYRGYGGGTLNLDEQFLANMQGASEAGIELGVYFFSQAITVEEAAEEANYVIENLEGFELAYPVCFDWETVEEEARTDSVDHDMISEFAMAFCETVEEAGYTAAIYFNRKQGYFTYDLEQLQDYKFWLAEYNDRPSFYFAFDIWQYSKTGSVDGIKGNVDLNICF